MGINRRHFVKTISTAAATASVAGLAPRSIRANPKSSLETLRFAVVGFKGRGKSLIGAIKASKSAKLVALADVDENVLNRQNADDKSLIRTDDFRKLLEREDIDCIASATPNHWHALVTVLATQAGKHVYIEKPISHNMFESQAIVDSSTQTGKLVQCGFQNRSDTGLTEFFSRLHSGEFGKVNFVHGTCHRPRRSIGKIDSPLRVPKHINYDLWLGPAKDMPLMRPNLHYDWHWDFNTGNGDVGNQGPHEWDMMNWAMGDPDMLPNQMVAAGNRFGWKDAGNTPNVMACAGELNKIPFCFEVMDLIPGDKPAHGRGVGVIIDTDKGRFIGGRGGGRFVFADGKVEQFRRTKKQDGTNDHMQNFVDCVLTNDASKLRAGCNVAARSSSMAHMANISYQLASHTSVNDLKNSFAGSSPQTDMINRMINSTEIYAKKHGINEIESWRQGPVLEFDNDNSQFVSQMAAIANQKMSREYRGEFTFPMIKS